MQTLPVPLIGYRYTDGGMQARTAKKMPHIATCVLHQSPFDGEPLQGKGPTRLRHPELFDMVQLQLPPPPHDLDRCDFMFIRSFEV